MKLKHIVGFTSYNFYRRQDLDLVIHAQAPKLSPYKRAIAESIAGLLQVTPERVSVKAKTEEGLGFIGKHEAMACTAVVLLATRSDSESA